MLERLSVRQMATTLRVRASTAFRWRHRLLSPLARQAQPILMGAVAACEANVAYSEKGSWYSDGPGARGLYRRGVTIRRPRFRWLADGKPSFVLLASAGEQKVMVNAGQGRPQPEVLQSCLSQVLGPGAEMCSLGDAPYAEACRRLGISHREAVRFTPLLTGLDRLRSHLYAWLHQFFGVATRYLDNYLAWLRFADRTAELEPAEAGRQLLVETDALMPPLTVSA